jgi:flagellar biosynthesis protein FliQ
MLAIALEQRGGVAAATAAVAALGIWSAVKDVNLSVLAFIPRVSAFFLVALLVGYLFERLQSTRETQRRLFESSLDPLIGVNVSGEITSVNCRTLALFDCRREQMIDEFLPGFFCELNGLALGARDPSLPHRLSGQKVGGSVALKVRVIPWESEEGALLLSLRVSLRSLPPVEMPRSSSPAPTALGHSPAREGPLEP